MNVLIRKLYLEGTSHLLRCNHQIFDTPLDTLLSRSLLEKQQWIDTMQLAQEALLHYREWAPPPRMAHLQAQQALWAWLLPSAPTPLQLSNH